MSRFFLILALFSLLAACAAPSGDGGLLTATPITTRPPDHSTNRPTDHPTNRPPDHPTNRPPDHPTIQPPTPTEAPLTLDTLGIPKEAQPYFQGLEKAITRKVGENGEVIYTTTATFWDGEQKQTAEYLLQPGTFDAHPEMYDDLTRPLTVQAFRLGENGEQLPVTLLWQGERRGFREAMDLTGAYDPELKQVDQHPYVHIVHGNRPIKSIKDLPKEDERLTALQSVRLEQAKAIRALQALREKLQTGEAITLEDLQGSVFLRRLQGKLQAGEPITEEDLYILFSPKAVEKWDAGGGLSLLFELRQDGSKWVYLKSKGNDQVAYAEKHTEDDYDSLNMKFVPLWFYTRDENGNIYHKVMIVTLDADDIERYKATQDPLGLQGKFIIAENVFDVEVSSENTYWPVLFRNNSPSFPYILLHAEGGDYFTKTDEELIQEMTRKGIAPETQAKILAERTRLAYLLSLPDNQAKDFEFWSHDINRRVQQLSEEKKLIEVPLVTPGIPYQCPPDLQFLELMFDVRISN